jgi:hypothetical protein
LTDRQTDRLTDKQTDLKLIVVELLINRGKISELFVKGRERDRGSGREREGEREGEEERVKLLVNFRRILQMSIFGGNIFRRGKTYRLSIIYFVWEMFTSSK